MRFFPMAMALLCSLAGVVAQVDYTGVNLAGAEFGGKKLPGVLHKDYTYPTEAEIAYFTSKGMNVFRLPFLWERLQPEEFGEFDGEELKRLRAFVSAASKSGAVTILDPHNYARYRGKVVGTADCGTDVFVDFWKRLAGEFKDDPKVFFGLMNEPHGMKTELWLANANAAIAAIRGTGAGNLILVPGNGFTGAHSWHSDYYGTPNAEVMRGIVDPRNNYLIEVHQYLDGDSSGRSAECVSATIGSERLKKFTEWCREHKQKAFLGEFATDSSETGLAALEDMLSYMEKNSDVWTGWTWWAAGPWWGDYMFSIAPKDGQDRPQLEVLQKHLKR